jgi:ABC-2 type transport system permease protein
MSTTTPPITPNALRVTFPRVLRSEWIKLRTLRSTVWCTALVLVLSVLFGLLLAGAIDVPDAAAPLATQQELELRVVTLGTIFTQLIAAVLGVLVISGEFGTGQIRSTFAAVPGRWPAVVAKALVLAAAVFVLGLVAAALTALATVGILAGKGVQPHLLDGPVLLPVLGSALSLALVAMLALGVGGIVRNGAAGIGIVLALLLVAPVVLSIFAALTRATWATNAAALLPSSAASQLYAFGGAEDSPAGGIVLDGWTGALVLIGWVVVAIGSALALLRIRDV